MILYSLRINIRKIGGCICIPEEITEEMSSPEGMYIQAIYNGINIEFKVSKMSCRSYSCRYDCCDYYGYCPSSSSSCYYYYNNAAMTAGAIIGIVIGILFFIGFVFLVVYLCRRCRERREVYERPIPPPATHTEIITMQPGYVGQPTQPAYYGQGSPYAQPYPYNQNQPNPYNQAPPYAKNQ